MYPQVQLDEDDQDLQWMLWREKPDPPLLSYRFCRLTFGLGPSACLSTRCRIQLVHEYRAEFPEATQSICDDFYVDDFISGASAVEAAKKSKTEVESILLSWQFELRKWISNEPSIIEQNSVDSSINHPICTQEIKTLGLIWNPSEEAFKYQVHPSEETPIVTKRSILSAIARIFDPLGLIAPLIIKAKSRIGWDEAISQELYTSWTNYQRQLAQMDQLKIPRFVLTEDPTEIQIHKFCDSSEAAYGARLYLRTRDISGVYHTQLLCAKSRVAPLSKITLAKLELCGANLLAKLHQAVMQSLKLPIEKTYLWTDSTIVLAWISSYSNQWNTFVANRVGEIQRIVPEANSNHVKSKDNPADILSRGADAQQLSKFKLWWSGPNWLAEKQDKWIIDDYVAPFDVPERKKNLSLSSTVSTFKLIENFSSLGKLKRIVAYVLRFKHNCLYPDNKRTDFLTVIELDKAINALIRICT